MGQLGCRDDGMATFRCEGVEGLGAFKGDLTRCGLYYWPASSKCFPGHRRGFYLDLDSQDWSKK